MRDRRGNDEMQSQIFSEAMRARIIVDVHQERAFPLVGASNTKFQMIN